MRVCAVPPETRSSSVVSLVGVDNLRKSATRGSRADEGVRPTFVPVVVTGQ